MADPTSLDALLLGTPSPRRWDAICDVLDRASDEQRADLIARAQAGLESWPDELREAPGHWLAAIARGEDVIQLELVRCLRARLAKRCEIGGSLYGAENPSEWHLQGLLGDPIAWATIIASPRVRGLTIVELDETEAERELEAKHEVDRRRAERGLDPLAPAEFPLRRIRSLAAADLRLRRLTLRGVVGPQPNPVPPRATSLSAWLVQLFRSEPVSEWRALLEGAGRSVSEWVLDPVTIGPELLEALTMMPELRWRSLDLHMRSAQSLAQLCRSPCMQRLESLRVSSSNPMLSELATQGIVLAELRSLSLVADFSAAGLFAVNQVFPGLTEVTLTGSRTDQLEQGQLDRLLVPELCARLEVLRLSQHAFEAIASLGGRSLPKLRILELTTADATVLAEVVRSLTRLERLTVHWLTLRPVLSHALADASALRELDLQMRIDDGSDLDPLLTGSARPEHVILGGDLDPAVFERLVRSPFLSRTRTLRLSRSGLIADEVLESVLDSPQLGALERLELYSYGRKISPLLVRPPAARLTALALSLAELRPDDIDALACSGWATLDELYFGGIDFHQSKHADLLERWLGSSLPARHKDRPGSEAYGWTLRDRMRLPPSEPLANSLVTELKRGLYRELAEDLRVRARSWPEPLRGRLLAAISAAPRFD